LKPHSKPYLPLLVNYTHEDADAKGLRKLTTQTEAQLPVYFSALEMAARERLLLITGAPGSGKTTFARHLAEGNVALPQAVPRNNHDTVLPESWRDAPVLRCYLTVNAPTTPAALLVGQPLDDALLIVDAAERLGACAPAFLAEVATLSADHPTLRIVLLGASDACGDWVLPAPMKRHALLPLLTAQRQHYDPRPADPRDDAVLGNPGLFLLSLDLAAVPANDYDLVRAWMAANDAAPHRYLDVYVAAQHLATLPAPRIAALFRADPARWRAPIEALARHRGSGNLGDLAAALMAPGENSLRAALLVADLLPAADVRDAMRQIVEQGVLPLPLRARAGRHLARRGDPRALDELVTIPAGSFVMGSAAHPNSTPPHPLALDGYQIGRYPVTNGWYRTFVDATGHHWQSVDGLTAERSNAPAVDLSWHDARAFCEWLTSAWRAAGRIALTAIVRLPTEPEWEYAARSTQPDRAALVYPWGGPWQAGFCNGEDSGFNDTCTVGLFPAGRALCGADDMAGHVWEWTTTLWGSDMATPSFCYPYCDDGREDIDAPGDIRRVLRGGCFSSGPEKANCTYRGSLEPAGFWRGNGFRIVVA